MAALILESEVHSLFDSCISVILRSLNVLENSSRVLPRRISQYILFEACNARDYRAVEVLVRSWSHPDLSFDFMQNRFCRRKKELSKYCLEAHNFFNVHSSCDYTDCVSSIALGLFNNIHTCLKENLACPIKVVDLSKIRISEQSQVTVLCKLIGGEFPVVHSTDYVSSVERIAYSISKPKLPKNVAHKVIIKLNIDIACHEVMTAIMKMVFDSVHFKVVYSGMGFSYPDAKERRFSRHFNELDLKEIYIAPRLLSSNELKSSPFLAKNGTLWLNTDTVFLPNVYRVLFSKLRIGGGTSPIHLAITKLMNNILIALMAQNVSVSSFSVLPVFKPMTEPGVNCRNVFEDFICANSENLKYLRLQHFGLTRIPLDSLQKCRKLRVLSVTSNTVMSSKPLVTVTQIFEVLQQLHRLEYFEWEEELNIFTKDVLALHVTLTTSLPKLQHWHWKLVNLILSTTDLDNVKMQPLERLLRVLLEGKSSSPSCTTYKFRLDNLHFRHWLETLKPLVCFHYLSQGSNCFSPWK